MARLDYYAVLGVARDATPDEIKKAFRQLALQFHPDRNPDDVDAERRFREVAEAYQCLSDPDERLRYDKLGPLYRPDGKPPTPEDVNTFVKDALAGLFGRRGGQERGEDLRYTLTVTLEEVGAGGEREIDVNRRVGCKRCDSSGADPDGGRKTCERCGGSGKSAARFSLRSECAGCDGRGFTTLKRCSRCGGEGRHDRLDTLKVKIPTGVATGQKLKLRGKGNEGRMDGATGDLFVLVSVADHVLFRRRGDDLLCEAPLLLTEAALGVDLAVPTLEGSTIIRVPPGTPSGKIFRLAGRGLPNLESRHKGDLHVKVNVEVPTAIGERERAALLALAQAVPASAHPQRRAWDELIRARR